MVSGYEWSSRPSSSIYYAAYERVYTTRQPTYECNNSNDLYQTKIGLITADEVMYAGESNANNYGYYLYTGNGYWTMSPKFFNSYNDLAYVFFVSSTGYLDALNYVNVGYGVRPVINLSTNNTITGNGTINDPFVVV